MWPKDGFAIQEAVLTNAMNAEPNIAFPVTCKSPSPDTGKHIMLAKLVELANKPKKPISVHNLLRLLLLQSLILLFVLVVVVVWPERAMALSTFVFISLGISVLLWLDIREAGVIQNRVTRPDEQ